MTSYPEQSLPLFPFDHDVIVTGAGHAPSSTVALMLGQTSGQIALSVLRDAYPQMIDIRRDDQLELLLSQLDRPVVMGIDLCGSDRDGQPQSLIQLQGEVSHYQSEQPVSRRRARRLRGRSRRG